MKILFLIAFTFSLFVSGYTQTKTIYGLKISKLIYPFYDGASFYMDETPVTYEDFEKYVRAGGEKNAYWYYESYHIKDQPVTGISWHHAADYCNWRSKCEGLKPVYTLTDSLDAYGYTIYEMDLTANGYRLPTSFEFNSLFNFSKKEFPWGEDFFVTTPLTDDHSNIDIDSGMKSTQWWRLAPVKSQYKTPHGIYNICGNIWHWCEDWNVSCSDKSAKSLFGGGWGVIDPKRTLEIGRCSPGNYNYDIGFRCVKNVEGISDSILKIDTTIQHEFYKPLSSQIKSTITDFYGEDFKKQLAKFISDNYPECINFQMKVDQQEIINADQMAELIIKVCKKNNINPLFLVSVMISESGFGTVSFPRWYNNPMAFMWQNKLMEKGYPTYENKPGKINRKYKTLEEGFEMFCKGIRRDLYYKAAKKNLDAFHLIYVGYRADEWMNTMKRIYRDIAGVRFEPLFPEGDAGKYIYSDWEKIKKNLK